MNGFFDFLVYYTIYLSVCAILYRLLIQGKYHPSMCRRLIIDILCFSVLLVPMCKITQISELSLNPGHKVVTAVMCIYAVGVVMFTVLFLVNFLRLKRIKRNASICQFEDRVVFLHDYDQLGCFSWFRYIFLPKSIKEKNAAEQKMILTHESAHLYLFHWLDLIGVNIFLIFQWYNPAVWYFRRELRQIHEYEADRRVLSQESIEKKEYELFLVEESSRKPSAGLAHGLSFSSLKSRLLMMNKEDLKTGIVERTSIIFGFAAAAICLL